MKAFMLVLTISCGSGLECVEVSDPMPEAMCHEVRTDLIATSLGHNISVDGSQPYIVRQIECFGVNRDGE